MKRKKQNPIVIPLVIFLILSTIGFINEVIIPSHASVQIACSQSQLVVCEPTGETGYQIAGRVFEVRGAYNVQEDEIMLRNSEDKQTEKHEMTHRLQAQQGRLGNCTNRQLMFWNEIEAYWRERL